MVDDLFPLMIGTLLGFLAGMGVGGGSLLLLWLTQVMQMEQAQARITNLLFFLPAAVISTLFNRKQSQIAVRPAVCAAIAGCIAAAFFSTIVRNMDVALLKKLLGALLILTGAREIFYRPRKAR